jgi:quercetin dioxygenase-like cupin family protein
MHVKSNTFLLATLVSALTLCGCSTNLSAVGAANIPDSVNVVTVLKTTTSWDGNAIVYPEGEAEVTGMIIEIPPGAETGWHLHPVPSFALLLEGELNVRLEDGRVKTLKAGEALAEVVDTPHNGRNTGVKPVKILVFYTSVVGKPLTTRLDRKLP